MIIKFWDSTEIDSNNAILNIVNKLDLSLGATGKKETQEILTEYNRDKEKFLKEASFNKKKLILLNNIVDVTELYLKNKNSKDNMSRFYSKKKIDLSHENQILGFGWQSSLFLRFLK